MKYLKSILLAFIIFVMTSCDYTMYVALRNYREPAKVCVTYPKAGLILWNNDTLLLKHINTPTFDSSLIRLNASDSSYCFIAPKGKEVALQPISFDKPPINQIRIFNSPDSVLTVNIEDRKEFKKLKKAGIIQTRGFIFTYSIFVENK